MLAVTEMPDGQHESQHDGEYDEVPAALGVVCEAGRGTLPFALLHGEALVACASWALGEAGVQQVDTGTTWAALAESGEPLVLHDPLCPATPADHLAACLRRCDAEQAVVVAVRPVTDTVKTVEPLEPAGGGVEAVGETVDRERLLEVASPVVLPPAVVAALAADGLDGALPADPGEVDLPAVVPLLAGRFPVVTQTAPATARRVAGPEDLQVLEALTGPPSRP